MNAETRERLLVILNVPPALEEDLVDWLLEREGEYGFRRLAVHGHSSSHRGLSMAEQVSGRRRRVQFETSIPNDDLAEFIAAAAQRFGGTDLYYQVLPVLAEGHFGQDSADDSNV